MTQPGTPPNYVPPTSTGQVPPGFQASPGTPAPPGFVAMHRPRPPQLGLTVGMTLIVAISALLTGLLLIVAAVIAPMGIGIGRYYAGGAIPPGVETLAMAVLVPVALIPLIYGGIALSAGTRLNKGLPEAWSACYVIHILSLVLGVLTVWGGVGLLHAIPSGIAFYNLTQPEMKAYFGQG